MLAGQAQALACRQPTSLQQQQLLLLLLLLLGQLCGPRVRAVVRGREEGGWSCSRALLLPLAPSPPMDLSPPCMQCAGTCWGCEKENLTL